MRNFEKRLGELERSVPLHLQQAKDMTTLELCKYLADLSPHQLRAALPSLTDSELDECIAEVRRYAPTYGQTLDK